MNTNKADDFKKRRLIDKGVDMKIPRFSSQVRSGEQISVVFNTKTDLKLGTARIFFYNMCNEMNKIGVNAQFRDWEKYEKYNFAIFKANDFESENARLKNPDIKIGLVHPSDLKENLIKELVNADFLIANTITERDYYLKYNKNIAIIHHSELEPKGFKNYENPEEKEKIILVYHGNKYHLELFDPELKNALERLSKKYPIKLKAIYNVKDLGIWEKGRPAIEIEDVQHAQSEDMEYIHKEIIEGDIGLVPAMTSMPYKLKEKILEKTKRYCAGPNDNDILVRYKNTSNAGRAFVFMQLGVPVVASPVPECCEVISPGETGFIALSEEGWIDAIEQLITDFSLRKRIALNAKKIVSEKYTSRKAAEKLYDYLLQYKRKEAFFSKIINPKEFEYSKNNYLIKKTSKFYDELHRKYDRRPPEWMKMYWNQFKGSVLEIGAGKLVPDNTINISNYLVAEISAIATKILKSKGIQSIVANGEDLPFSSNTFDVVACHDVLEHTPDPEKFIAEMCRVSRERVIVLGPNYLGEKSSIQRKHSNLTHRTLDVIRGKHKKVIRFKNPYFSYDEKWESDLDAISGVNLWWVERQIEKNGVDIIASTTFMGEGITAKIFKKTPFVKYTGSMMFIVCEKTELPKSKELGDTK